MSSLPELGSLSVALALGAAVYAAVASVAGAHWRLGELVASGRRGLVASAALATIAMAILALAFVRHDFALRYVWQNSNLTTPLPYLLAGIWGGQAGSLLFWGWLLALQGAIAVWRPWRADQALLPWFTAIVALVVGFFLFLATLVSSPFARLAVEASDGVGLNPLLQHPGMAFHPPALYAGFTGMTIPFAFAMAALVTRRTDAAWIQASRRWMLVAWLFLTIGLALGARWAYDVLGWGGYWGWDPVENAALMPWLAATAFLHSVIVQERRGMFKAWNMALIIVVFGLTIVGTFLTRAGLLSSVHAFAQSAVGPYFLAFAAAVVLGSLAIMWWRLPELRTSTYVGGALSREGTFLVNNLLFMAALFAVMWGTLFPLLSEIVVSQRVTAGPPYFNTMVAPLLGLIVAWMAVGPLATWGRTDRARLGRSIAPSLVASLAAVAAMFVVGVRDPRALAGIGAALLALAVTVTELARGARARTRRGEGLPSALVALCRLNRRRYGGYVVHIGVALVAIGVIGSSLYKVDTERALVPGEAVALGSYQLTYAGLGERSEPDRYMVLADVLVTRADRPVGRLAPGREVYRQREDQPISVPSVLHRPLEDVYSLLATYDPSSGQITLRAQLVPLIGLLWLGVLVVVGGTLVAAWPDRAEARVLDAEVRRLLGPPSFEDGRA